MGCVSWDVHLSQILSVLLGHCLICVSFLNSIEIKFRSTTFLFTISSPLLEGRNMALLTRGQTLLFETGQRHRWWNLKLILVPELEWITQPVEVSPALCSQVTPKQRTLQIRTWPITGSQVLPISAAQKLEFMTQSGVPCKAKTLVGEVFFCFAPSCNKGLCSVCLSVPRRERRHEETWRCYFLYFSKKYEKDYTFEGQFKGLIFLKVSSPPKKPCRCSGSSVLWWRSARWPRGQ